MAGPDNSTPLHLSSEQANLLSDILSEITATAHLTERLGDLQVTHKNYDDDEGRTFAHLYKLLGQKNGWLSEMGAELIGERDPYGDLKGSDAKDWLLPSWARDPRMWSKPSTEER